MESEETVYARRSRSADDPTAGALDVVGGAPPTPPNWTGTGTAIGRNAASTSSRRSSGRSRGVNWVARLRPREGRRGQTEPLAALVAVAAVCLALSTFAVYVADVLPAGSDRAVEDATSERVWAAIGTDGVYDPDTDLDAAIDETVLPAGYTVSVTVTTADENGTASVVAETQFVPVGTNDDGPRPTDPPTDRRPIAVQYAPGDVRGGTLVVEVWK